MAEIILNAKKRNDYKEQTLNQLRKNGIVPGIYYWHGVINLKVDDDKGLSCILKDVQFHPISDKPIHFDLIAIKEGESITIEVSVQLKGTAPGVKEGGVIQQILYKLELECLPSNIPSHIDVDISNLNVNDSIKVGDLKIENVKILNDENSAIVAVVPPTVEKEPVVEAVEEPAEPELISKSKKEEGEEEEK
jgi:large subunit ribosomal protein L25